MKKLTFNTAFMITFLMLLASSENFAQTQVSVSQDSKFEQLLSEKRKLNATTTNTDRYKIQIYNGDAENAKTTLADYKKLNKNNDGNVVFNTPIYKVWVGNFKTRIEAEKNLVDLKKKYPLAFLVKPLK